MISLYRKTSFLGVSECHAVSGTKSKLLIIQCPMLTTSLRILYQKGCQRKDECGLGSFPGFTTEFMPDCSHAIERYYLKRMALKTFVRKVKAQWNRCFTPHLVYHLQCMVKMINPPLLQTIGYQPQEAAVLSFQSEIPSDFTQLSWSLLPTYFTLNKVITCRLQKTESKWHVMNVSQTTIYAWDQIKTAKFEEES